MNAFYKKPIGFYLFISLFTTIFADTDPTRGCCKKKIHADKVITNTLCVKENAQFNGDVNINGNLTVHGEITPVRNKFHGWWRRLSKINDDVQFLYINAIDADNITASFYGGTLQNAFQYSSGEGPWPLKLINDRTLCREIDASKRLISVQTNPAIPGTPFPAVLAEYSPQPTTSVSGVGGVANPESACTLLTNDLTNKIGVCRRGGCGFIIKTANIEAAGGIATIVVNNDDNIFAMSGAPTGNGLSVMIGLTNGNSLISAIDADPNLNVTIETQGATFPDDNNQYLVLQEGGEFDGLLFWGYEFISKNETYQLTAQGTLYEKLQFDVAVGDQIRPWGNGDNAFPDSNSRRFMFEQLNDNFFGNGNPAFSPAGLAERLMPRPERLTLFDTIMNQGVERDPVAVYTINKSTKNSRTTTLMTIGTYPFVSCASKVRLSGLEGEWAVLNDHEFQVASVTNTDNENVQQQSPFYLAETRTYHILILVDTATLPPFDPTIHAPHGALIHPSKVGPITEDIEYREWIDAALYYTQKVLQQSAHSVLQAFFESTGFEFIDQVDANLTKAPLATWQDVSSAILGNIAALELEAHYQAGFPIQGSLICPSYYLPYNITFNSVQINEPFEELGIPGSDFFPDFFPEYAIGTLPIIGFNVPFENYLLPESRRWLYFRVQPDTPVTNEQQANVWVLGYTETGEIDPLLRGYASVGPDGLNTGGQLGGSRLEGLVSPVPYGVYDQNLEEGFWSPFVNFDISNPTVFNAGIINPALVGGRRIGYMTFIGNILHDQELISLNINFGNPELALSPDPELRKRQQYDGEAAVIAELMRYFVEDQQVEAIIIDNRINGGFSNTQSLLESFGGARQGGTSFSSFQDQDYRNPFNVDKEMTVFGGTRLDNRTLRKLVDTTPWPTVRPDLMELRYPGSVFKNGPVIILDSQSAKSGGDQFPRFFMGDNLDGDLGNGVHAKIVGTIDGILEGYDSNAIAMIRSRYGSEFPDFDGIGTSPLFMQSENLLYNEIAGAPTSTRYNPYTNYTEFIEALIPVNSNLTGPMYAPSNTGTPEIVQGALSTNIGDTVYFDFGYTGPGTAVDGTPYATGHWDNPPTGINQVNGFPGQPNPNDPSSLRDSWLEEALRVTRLSLGDAVTKSAPSKGAHKSQNPSKVAQNVARMFAGMSEAEIKEYVIAKQKFANHMAAKENKHS